VGTPAVVYEIVHNMKSLYAQPWLIENVKPWLFLDNILRQYISQIVQFVMYQNRAYFRFKFLEIWLTIRFWEPTESEKQCLHFPSSLWRAAAILDAVQIRFNAQNDLRGGDYLDHSPATGRTRPRGFSCRYKVLGDAVLQCVSLGRVVRAVSYHVSVRRAVRLPYDHHYRLLLADCIHTPLSLP